MPLPNPSNGESEQDYVSRVIPELVNAGHKQDQAAAIAYSEYSKAHKDISNPPDMELVIGTAHEMAEHGLDMKMGAKIASDHLKEHPDYYSKLKQVGLM